MAERLRLLISAGFAQKDFQSLLESFCHDAHRRHLAWRGLDICNLGRDARWRRCVQSMVGSASSKIEAETSTAVVDKSYLHLRDISLCLSRVGLLPRRERWTSVGRARAVRRYEVRDV